MKLTIWRYWDREGVIPKCKHQLTENVLPKKHDFFSRNVKLQSLKQSKYSRYGMPGVQQDICHTVCVRLLDTPSFLDTVDDSELCRRTV